MAEFLASITRELEVLHAEHARIVERLRIRHQQVTSHDSGQEEIGHHAADGALELRPEQPPPSSRCSTGMLSVLRQGGDNVDERSSQEKNANDDGGDSKEELPTTEEDGGTSGGLMEATPSETFLVTHDMSAIPFRGFRIEAMNPCEGNDDTSDTAKSEQVGWQEGMGDCSTDLLGAAMRNSTLRLAPRDVWALPVEKLQRATQGMSESQPSREAIDTACIELVQTVRQQSHGTGKTGSLPWRSSRASNHSSDTGTSIGTEIVSLARRVSMRGSIDQKIANLDWRSKLVFIEFPISPHSRVRLAWDLLGMLLVMYEAVTIPVLLLLLPSRDRVDIRVDIVLNIYWSFDIGITFCTSLEVSGELVSDWWFIARRYASTWLWLDLLMVLPEWVLALVQGGLRGGFSVLRILKIARILRLLRVLKMENRVRRQLSRINSSSVLNALNLAQMVVGFMLANHFMGCVWFALGRETGNGWLSRYDSEDVSDGYMMALHWAIAQFHGTATVGPGNIPERAFAVTTQVVGLLTFSIFVSVTTNLFLQERHTRRRLTERRDNLRIYFGSHKISSELMFRVNCAVAADLEQKEWVDDFEVLKGLPNALQRNVLFEARMPIIEKQCLFAWLKDHHGPTFRKVCYCAFYPSHHVAGNIVFEAGDAWDKAIFVENGGLRYIEDHSAQSSCSVRNPSKYIRQLSMMQAGEKITRKAFLCELALWVQGWQCKGNLIAVSNSCLLCVDSGTLTQALKDFPPAQLDVTMYVHGILYLITASAGVEWNRLNDLWNGDRNGRGVNQDPEMGQTDSQ